MCVLSSSHSALRGLRCWRGCYNTLHTNERTNEQTNKHNGKNTVRALEYALSSGHIFISTCKFRLKYFVNCCQNVFSNSFHSTWFRPSFPQPARRPNVACSMTPNSQVTAVKCCRFPRLCIISHIGSHITSFSNVLLFFRRRRSANCEQRQKRQVREDSNEDDDGGLTREAAVVSPIRRYVYVRMKDWLQKLAMGKIQRQIS